MITNIKCPACGASITINPRIEKQICEYCNTPFFMMRQTNKYDVQREKVEAEKEIRKEILKQQPKTLKEELRSFALPLLLLGLALLLEYLH